MRVLEIDRHTCAILTDQVARDVERAGRIGNRFSDRDTPTRPLRSDARKMRMIEPDARDRGIAVAAEFDFANGVAWLVDQRGEIERRFRIEDDPKRIGPAKDRRRRRRWEWKTQFQIGALSR